MLQVFLVAPDGIGMFRTDGNIPVSKGDVMLNGITMVSTIFDNFNITEDIKIDDYLKQGIKKVLFSKYSYIEPFPIVDDGFLCSSAVIITDKITLSIEPEKAHLLYDEICRYGHDYYTKPIAEEGKKIGFRKSKWRKDNLLSLSFCCEGKAITISASAEYDCLIVCEE